MLTTILVFVFLSNTYSQCNDPTVPGLTCQSAIAFCDNEIDGYCSATYNSGVGTAVGMPPFCGSVQNNQWLRFVAGTTSISLEFTVDNCANGDGLQVIVMHSDDCVNFTAVTNCYTASTSGGGGGVNVFILEASDYIVGETYFIMLDGWLGDYCDYSIQVLTGSTSVPPLSTPSLPSGLTPVCPGATSITYSIPAVPFATGYNWSLPAGTTHTLSADGLSVNVDYSTSAISGNICVEAYNDCELGSQICLPITIQNLPPSIDYGEYCAGETFYYLGNNTNYTAGSYYITIPGASVLGCDSIVQLEVIENPIKETFLMETICEGETFEVGGITFNQSNASLSVSLTSSEGCDSTVYLDLTVLNPQAIIQQPEIINCNSTNVFINGAFSNADIYNWSTSTGNIIGGLGTSVVTVDAAGLYLLEVQSTHLGVTCSASTNVVVEEYFDLPQININSTDLSCNGSNDGSANATPTGGEAPYTYSWSTGVSTPSISDLTPGNYSLTLTGTNGCESVESFLISEPAALSYNIVLENVTCSGSNNGIASATASGGLAPYTYEWSTGTVSNLETGLAPGNYDLSITDANGCQIYDNFNITEPDPILLAASSTQAICNGETGSASITATGGSGSLSYQWSSNPIQTTPTISNLPAGIYAVTVTDQSNCTASTTVEILEPAEIQLNITGSNPTCFNSSNGTVAVTASGGSGTLAYFWNTPQGHTSPSLSDLQAGLYEVTVTDENNCFEIINIDLEDPDDFVITFNTQDILCHGNATGAITASVVGGTAPYTYNWDDVSFQNTASATELPTGIYTVTITDANNCTVESSAILTEPMAGLEIIANATPANCGITNGAFDLTINGGIAPYSFEWTNGLPPIEDPTSLGAGTYTVIVTDDSGCSTSENLSINTTAGLDVSVDLIDVSCYGLADGQMDVTVVGGIAPYSFEWNDTSNNDNEDFINIAANDYSVTITDSDGCSVVATGIIEEPEALIGTAIPIAATCGGTDGNIEVIVSGGVEPYDFDWNLIAYDGMQNLTNLPRAITLF